MSEHPIEEHRVELSKTHELVVATLPIKGESSQKKAEQKDAWETPDDAIQPPLSLDQLARLSEISGIRGAIIDAIARNTVGLGYTLGVSEGHEEQVDDLPARAREGTNLLEALASRDTRLDRPTFADLLYAVKTDEEEVGWGFIEVSRSKTDGRIDGIFHCPGKRMRRLKDRSGFLMLDSAGGTDQAVRFYNFGEKAEYDDDGTPTGIKSGKDDRNEVIVFRRYTSLSRDYGAPRDHGMALEYLGDKLAAESNISFFDSSGTPPTIIFVQGDETQEGGKTTFSVPQKTVEAIADTLKSGGGYKNRVGIIPLPPGAKTDAVQLGKVSDKDMGFNDYRADNRRRILGSFRLSPIFIADLEDAGRYTAEVERALTLEQVFDPDQRRYEGRLNSTLMKDAGLGDLAIKFKRLAVEGDSVRRESAESMSETGTITRAEFRQAQGWPPLPEAELSTTEIVWTDGEAYKSAEPKPGEVPHGWGERLVNTGKPAGAENRTLDADSQQGLRPGIGARRRRQETSSGPQSAEAGAAATQVGVKAAGRASASRARERAGTNGGS
jgi:capsid portal protein